MGLPSSGTLSISDIANEFGVSLSNVALNATLGTYASKGAGATTAISDFYGLSNLTSFTYNATGSSEGGGGACDLTGIADTGYHNGSGTSPVVGDNCFSDSGATPLTNGNAYKFANGTDSGGFLNIGASGVVSSIGNCR